MITVMVRQKLSEMLNIHFFLPSELFRVLENFGNGKVKKVHQKVKIKKKCKVCSVLIADRKRNF